MTHAVWRRLAATCLCLPALAVSCHARTDIKPPHTPPHSWAGSVRVAPDAPAAITTKANPVCEQLTADTRKHLGRQQALIIDIAKSTTALPSTVYGAVKAMAGHPVIDSDTKRKLQNLDRERKSVGEFNRMLAEAHCQRIDVEHDAAQIPAR